MAPTGLAPRGLAPALLALLALRLAAAEGQAAEGGGQAAESGDLQHFFYFNSVTGDSTWEDPHPQQHHDKLGYVFYADPRNASHTWWPDAEPEEFAWVAATSEQPDTAGKVYYWNHVTKTASWELPASLAWKAYSTNKTFYYNHNTGEKQWERPTEMGHVDEKTGQTFWVDENGEPTWESEHTWMQVPVEEGEHKGQVYYVNVKTKETTWEKPAALSWEMTHAEHGSEEL